MLDKVREQFHNVANANEVLPPSTMDLQDQWLIPPNRLGLEGVGFPASSFFLFLPGLGADAALHRSATVRSRS
ncbi:MAG: hypothetical protein ACI88C_001643 [Acidimicrobiales bacterium]|jgi:hypothetical protein